MIKGQSVTRAKSTGKRLNSAAMRRAILSDLRTINRWMRIITARWNPNQTGDVNPATGTYDHSYQTPAADLPEHNAAHLAQTIQYLSAVVKRATLLQELAERMLVEVTAGRDPDAARAHSDLAGRA